MACAVENGHTLAAFQAQNVQRVVRLASVQPQQIITAVFRRQIKAVHIQSSSSSCSSSISSENEDDDGDEEDFYLKNFFAFSKNLCASGASWPSQSAANSL